MKKVLLWIFTLILFVGCEKYENIRFPETGNNMSDVVSVEEALKQLSLFHSVIVPNTRSGKNHSSLKSIHSISVCGGRETTRSGVCVDLPDTMVYIVNFIDNEGFAVLGARRSLEPIYIVSESGSFDAEKLDKAIARLSEQSENERSRALSSDAKSFSDIGTDYIYDLMAFGLMNSGNDGVPSIGGWNGTGTTTFLGYSDWKIIKKEGPLVTVKWNQTHPFNMSMDTNRITAPNKFYTDKYPVGCGIIAMAQIMSCVKKPAMAPAALSVSCDWENLKTVSNYENVGLYFQPGAYTGYNYNYAKQLADVLYYLGTCFGRQYINGESMVSPQNIIVGLKNLEPNYYADANFDVVSLDKIYAQLDNGKPLFMLGKNETGAGHAWVVDGYASASREGTYLIQNENQDDMYMIKFEQANFIHVNWGYSGAYDGYYTSFLLDMSKREIKDEVVDGNIIDTPGLSLDLHYDNRVIYY